MVKDLVISEAQREGKEKPFCDTIATILKKDLKMHLAERSSFIILAFVESESISHHFTSEEITPKMLKSVKKSHPKAKGVQLIAKKLS